MQGGDDGGRQRCKEATTAAGSTEDESGDEDLNDREPKDDSEGSTNDSQSRDTVIHSSSLYRLLLWINLAPDPMFPPLALTGSSEWEHFHSSGCQWICLWTLYIVVRLDSEDVLKTSFNVRRDLEDALHTSFYVQDVLKTSSNVRKDSEDVLKVSFNVRRDLEDALKTSFNLRRDSE
ncbi:unnamed protein product [Heligmosomoides polygyrus]|uniref:COMM domain-containing protein n=1 Tax=Heligmosomoides polygyrus TaxID=6339 RepID=A0A183FPC2_HELPZ|nr:unnamed protein product [Heligmosomoides polygyrus]